VTRTQHELHKVFAAPGRFLDGRERERDTSLPRARLAWHDGAVPTAENAMGSEAHAPRIARELALRPAQVEAALALLGGGATVPFIARYRKEATGSLDEVALAAVRDRRADLAALDARREAILGSLAERGLLTDDLHAQVAAAETLAALEDVYLPHRPKRRTRAQMARERGLEPLADRILAQDGADPLALARTFVDPAKDVPSAEGALAGARDVIAERVAEDAAARAEARDLFARRAVIRSAVLAGKEEAGAKFRDYFDAKEPLASAPSHRVLAMRRGESEEVLALRVEVPEEEALALLERRFVRGRAAASEEVRAAVRDGWKRLLAPSLETEARVASKRRADEEAIRVFSANVRELLLAAPLGGKPVLALDPGFRTGCKVVALDAQGKLLAHEVVYPLLSEAQAAAAARTLGALAARFRPEAVAVGNGTGGRETEAFLRGLELPGKPPVVLVNESGASIYSASEVAREEFPDKDLTVRGAVSIGRRLQDPLAELVKIDAKSIGVGQYQHDVEQAALERALDDVVASAVNRVGVEVNTASKELLSYVSGLSARLAAGIVARRDERGPFRARAELREVAGLGPKTFEQAAGFLRIRGAANPLDASAVHPESYAVVEAMARDVGCEVKALLADEALRGRIRVERYASESVGLPTLRDILEELAKPGRDPRARFDPVRFADGVRAIEDLAPGMKLEGVVTNVTAFGAFVDVGVHQDGLVHVSQIADRRVREPAEVVRVGAKVRVTVLDVDLARRRISLSMKTNPEPRGGGDGGVRRAAAPPTRQAPTQLRVALDEWKKRPRQG
jgi:uncharacterized protein